MEIEKTIEFLLDYYRKTAEQIHQLAERQNRVEADLHELTLHQREALSIMAEQQRQIGRLVAALGTMSDAQRMVAEAQAAAADIQRKGLEQLQLLAQKVEILVRTFEEYVRRTGPMSRPN